MKFEILFRLSPPGAFGLPDPTRLVVPAGPAREIFSPTMHAGSGVLVNHGTLPEYRHPDKAISLEQSIRDAHVRVSDNFLTITLESPTADLAHSTGRNFADVICQSVSAQLGIRFSAVLLLVQDEKGVPQRVGQVGQFTFSVTMYDTKDTADRLATAIGWAAVADERARKALLYFEHGLLLSEFAQTLPYSSPHSSFSWALAFLQLFKALVAILGEPGTDRDYQSRAGRLGLAPDFWSTRVKELYVVRNDEDVAHYTLSVLQPGAMTGRFGQASGLFREALAAYMKGLGTKL